MLALNPLRVINDATLPEMVRQFSAGICIYVMAHFNHPRELTPEAIEALRLMRSAGAVIVNQTPLIHGVNDDPAVLSELLDTLSFIGVAPYYVFQCRPTLGNEIYSVPIEQGYGIVTLAQSRCSGLAKRCRFVMSHDTGKVEVVGRSHEMVFMRYHQAVHSRDIGRMLVLKSNPEARWLDDYGEIAVGRDQGPTHKIGAMPPCNGDAAQSASSSVR
jgi:L-lysine 2,3-aminomutase